MNTKTLAIIIIIIGAWLGAYTMFEIGLNIWRLDKWQIKA